MREALRRTEKCVIFHIEANAFDPFDGFLEERRKKKQQPGIDDVGFKLGGAGKWIAKRLGGLRS